MHVWTIYVCFYISLICICRKVLFDGGHNIPYPFDITVDRHMLYFTDQTRMGVMSLDVLNPRDSLRLVEQGSQKKYVYQIDYASAAKQYSTSMQWLMHLWINKI